MVFLLYKDEKCPVCERVFQEGDDIVTCPECGTPHHRECYASLGKCVNSDLHSNGFVYKRKEQSSDFSASQEIKKAPSLQNAAPSAFGNLLNNQGSESEGGQEDIEEKAANAISDAHKFKPGTAFIFDKNEKIDGAPLSDIITAIGANFYKFIGKFRKNKTVNWNWSAFFFGPYYLLFRKIYGMGTALLSIRFAVSIIVSAIYAGPLNTLMTMWKDTVASVQTMTNAEYMRSILSAIQDSKALPAYIIVFAVVAVIHISCALFADNIYRKKIVNLVLEADEKIEQENSFYMGMLSGAEDYSKSKIKKLYLANKGGISVMAPIMAMLIVEIFSDIVSMI